MQRPDVDADATRFARVEALLDGALELSPSARASYIQREAGSDDALRDEALELLAAIDASDGFLEAPRERLGAGTPPFERLGPWAMGRLLGRGGSGDVWLGERVDGEFEQRVAIKLLRDWHPDDVPRFLREQRLLARLDHPGIATLIDAGRTPSGQPYMVIEYIDGESLTDHVRRRQLDIAARLVLFLQVCEAVAYAHRHLVVHRDLKPQNILVRDDGRVALLDFGISRLVDDGARADVTTRKHQLTPQYAAPEQLAGAEETTATDVYALGLLLHELLAGQSPWGRIAGHGAMALLQRIQDGPPPAPSGQASREDAPAVRGDLDAIVLKATRPEPEQRYRSVAELIDDIERHRSHRIVAARADRLGYRVRRTLRRYWLAASITTLFVAGLVTALVLVSAAQRETVRERDIAQMEASRSKAVRDYLAHMFRDANQSNREGVSLTAKQVLDQAAARVDASFANDPAGAAEVLRALGELHFYIDDYAGAAPLLQRWLTHEEAIADPVAAADVRFTLAETLHRMGRSDEAATLLDASQAFWSTDPARHADVLLTSRMLQSQLERQRGDVPRGIVTLEAALPLRLQRSGRDHFETAALQTNLGAAYIQAGRVDDGIAASEEAMRTWRALKLERGNDALNTLNNLAAAYFRQGDMARAETAFAEALAVRRETLGPSAATAALMGNYARVLLKLGKTDAALPLVDEALAMARTTSGETSPLTLSLRVSRADALLQSGQLDDADAALEALAAVDGIPVPLAARADILRGLSAVAAERWMEARTASGRAAVAIDSMGPAGDALRPDLEQLHLRVAAQER